MRIVWSHLLNPQWSITKIFAKKNNIQNDDIFYEKFEDLKIIGNIQKKGLTNSENSYTQDDSQLSLREENFFNTEFIKMINSTTIVRNFLKIFN